MLIITILTIITLIILSIFSVKVKKFCGMKYIENSLSGKWKTAESFANGFAIFTGILAVYMIISGLFSFVDSGPAMTSDLIDVLLGK